MAVGLTALNELRLKMIQLVLEFLTHSLAQGITLTAGKVGKQT